LQVRLQELSLEDTLDALASVAQAIAQGIGRKWAEEQLEERVHERTRELALLLEVSQNITSTLELNPLLDTILTQLKTVVDYRAAVLYALQDDRLTILNYQGEQSLEQIKSLLSVFEQDMTPMLKGHQHDPFIIDDIYQQARLSQRLAEEVDTSQMTDSAHLHSWMGVPLIAKDRAIGLLIRRSLRPSQRHARSRRHSGVRPPHR
jgi:GAF domain-containing protein